MREKSIEKNYIKRITEEFNCETGKFEVPGKDGMPDRIVLLEGGVTVLFEFKKPGETPRPLQRHRIKTLQSLGFLVYAIDSMKEIETVLEELRCVIRRTRTSNTQRIEL